MAMWICAMDKKIKYCDYGKEKNLKIYGSEGPKLLDEANIKIPVEIMSAEKDLNGTPEACQLFVDRVNEGNGKELARLYVMEEWGHNTIVRCRHPQKLFEIIDKMLSS